MSQAANTMRRRHAAGCMHMDELLSCKWGCNHNHRSEFTRFATIIHRHMHMHYNSSGSAMNWRKLISDLWVYVHTVAKRTRARNFTNTVNIYIYIYINTYRRIQQRGHKNKVTYWVKCCPRVKPASKNQDKVSHTDVLYIQREQTAAIQNIINKIGLVLDAG